MKILLTGAFGNVGVSTLDELLNQGHSVKILELPNKKWEKRLKKSPYKNRVSVICGDLCNVHDIEAAVKNVDGIIHLGAIIPPLADHRPELAYAVNVGGTRKMIRIAERINPQVKFFYTSSISVYGDRRQNPYIQTTDPAQAGSHDKYGQQKLEAETLVRASSLDWTIFRLTYITSMQKLNLDPLMYDMPLETCIELCDTKDVGYALVNALHVPEVHHQIFHIAGGDACRTTFGEYLTQMMDIFGLGENALPAEAFSKTDFHCGWMDTQKSQQLLQYQRMTLETYYANVRKAIRGVPFFLRIFRPIAKHVVMKRSPYYQKIPREKRRRKFLHSISHYLQIMGRTTENMRKILQHEQISLPAK